MTVPVRLRMRPQGTTNWINLPEVHVVRQATAPFAVAIKLMFQAPATLNTALANYDSGGPVRCYTTVPVTTTVAPIGVGGWTSDPYFYSGANDTNLRSANVTGSGGTTSGVQNVNLYLDRAEFYLSGSGTPFPRGNRWEVQILRGQAFREASFNTSTYQINPGTLGIYDFFGYVTISTVQQTIYDQRNISNTIELTRFISLWNAPPVPDPTLFALIAVKVTNRSISELSVLASGYVNDWDGSGWNNLIVTSNPAPHLYDVYAGVRGGSPLPVALIDSAALVAFRTLCISKSYTCNAVVEGKTYIDVATMIAACGYARPSHSELWGVCIDQDVSGNAPVQIFNPRNASGLTVSKAFARLPTGIRATYNDSSNNYLANEVIVFADPSNPDSSRLEQIAYDGLVALADVQKRAKFDLLQMQLRLAFYKFRAPVESIVCRKGDLVGLQVDTFDNYAGFSRIASITTSNGLRTGGNVTGITLDGSIRVNTLTGLFSQAHLFTVASIFDLGGQTGCQIRLKAGAGIFNAGQVTAAANDSLETVLTFATPFADPGIGQLDVGCLISTGRLGTEYRRMKVFGVQPQDDRSANVVLVDEAPSLWT
jgi:hypothetical protein